MRLFSNAEDFAINIQLAKRNKRRRLCSKGEGTESQCGDFGSACMALKGSRRRLYRLRGDQGVVVDKGILYCILSRQDHLPPPLTETGTIKLGASLDESWTVTGLQRVVLLFSFDSREDAPWSVLPVVPLLYLMNMQIVRVHNLISEAS